mmetsp:Transcript_28471/g.66141  ORF Transcript_28471/g.66141 Transcript_28471/m.66141 type:complete len:330 (+) Transcript_28471:869-1858(+)
MNLDKSFHNPKKKKVFVGKIRQQRLSKITYQLFDITRGEQDFILLILVLLLLCRLVLPYPHLAMWFGFTLASYSAIANDSIQTIGTFIASNAKQKWWHLWLFMGVLFIGTVTYSWVVYDGDVSYQRLTAQGFSKAPQTFEFWQLFSPIALLILTRMRIPVSTTFLLLNVFATDANAMFSIFQKSLYGYLIAFFLAIVVWYLTARFVTQYFKSKPGLGWIILQWITSGLLWSVWLMQDASNIAVFLPRKLGLTELLLFIGLIFAGLGVLFYLKGDRMQQLISEKAGIKDIRAASLVDFVYMTILFYFKSINNLPMSTTWVFIGLLGGRES